MFSEFEPVLDPAARLTPLEVEVRGGTPADVTAVGEIRRERWGGDLSRHERWARRHIERALAEPNRHCFLVATGGEEVLGYATAGLFEPDAGAPPNAAPAGYYLRGVVVKRAARRRGLGRRLTAERLAWIADRASQAYYCVSSENHASIKLHESFGFVESSRDFWFPRLDFSRHGGGLLYVARNLRGR